MTLATMIQVGNAAIAVGYAAAFCLIVAVVCGTFDWAADRYNAWAAGRDDTDHILWWSRHRTQVDTDGWGLR